MREMPRRLDCAEQPLGHCGIAVLYQPVKTVKCESLGQRGAMDRAQSRDNASRPLQRK